MSDDNVEPKKPAINFGKIAKKPKVTPKMPKMNPKGFGAPSVVRRSGRGR